MYSHFERQYKEFLRANLSTLDISSHRATEDDLLSYLRPIANISCSPLVPSQKSEDLAQAHLAYGRELKALGEWNASLTELVEAVRNCTSPTTLDDIMRERGEDLGGPCSTKLPKLPGGQALSPEYPYVEGSVEVRDCEERGRHVVATRDIAIG